MREVRRLVLVTPFDSLVNVARAHLPWMPVSLLMRDRYDSASRAPEVSSRTLVVIAEADEIVPRAASEALVLAFRERPRVVVLEGAGHNGIDLDPGYLEEVAAFLGR